MLEPWSIIIDHDAEGSSIKLLIVVYLLMLEPWSIIIDHDAEGSSIKLLIVV